MFRRFMRLGASSVWEEFVPISAVCCMYVVLLHMTLKSTQINITNIYSLSGFHKKGPYCGSSQARAGSEGTVLQDHYHPVLFSEQGLLWGPPREQL